MALSFAHGAVQWLAADAANVTYAVTGLGFTPKAIKFWTLGLSSAVDAESSTTHIRRSFGFATSPTDRRCVMQQDQDAAADMLCTTGARDDAVIATVTSTGPACDGRLDLSSMDAGGFTLIVDDATPVDLTVFWEAWGGSDIILAQTLEFSEPAATGSQSYPVIGFTTGDAEHQVVMFAGTQQTAATPSVSRGNSGWMLGYATGTGNLGITASGNNVDAGTASETSRYNQTGECLSMQTATSATDNPTARASFSGFGDNIFTLNWIARATTGRKYIALAIKGGSWAAGSTTIARGTLNATATISGLDFTPLGIDIIYNSNLVVTAGTGTAGDYLSLGTGSSTTSRRVMSAYSEDSDTSSFCFHSIQYDEIAALDVAGTLDSAIDINQMNADGFQLIVDDASAFAATVWLGYLAFGNGTSTVSSGGPGLGAAVTTHRYHRYSMGG